MAEADEQIDRDSATGGNDPQEQAWIGQAISGDTRAFEHLYRLHAGRIYALCLRLSSDPELAQGHVQDVFVRAWRKLEGYGSRGPFGAWLRRLAINQVIDAQRKEQRERRLFTQAGEDSEMMQEASIGSDIREGGAASVPPQKTELSLDLERAVASLPPGARQVFVLHDVEGWRQREIATLTDVAVGTVKAQLFRARRLLRVKLEGTL